MNSKEEGANVKGVINKKVRERMQIKEKRKEENYRREE